MNNIKRLFLALVVLGLSAPAFADSTVLEPNQRGGFKVGIDALYLRPTNSDLYFATKSPNIILSPIEQENFSVETKYNWGVYGQIGYLFPCTSNDLTLGYTYLHSKQSTLARGPGSSLDYILAFPPTWIGAFSRDPDHFGVLILLAGDKLATAKFNLNAADLEGGERFTSGDYDLRMFGGLRYASVGYALSTIIYPNLLFLAPGSSFPPSDQAFNSQFSGIGPRIGADGRYCLGSNFAIDANLSMALLVGHLTSNFKSNVTSNAVAAFPLATSHFEVISDSQTRVVPVLEGKLGIDYIYPISSNSCCNQSVLLFEAGYQVTHYFNVVEHTKITQFVIPETDTRYFNSQNSISDVGFDGIYFGVKYYI